MITSDCRARMLLSCAVEGGDPDVAELVQGLGAQGAWAKIIEGVLGEPVAQRAARVRVEVFERLAEAAAARFVVPGDDEWPGGFDDLRHAEPIQPRGGEPFGLWRAADLVDQGVIVLSGGAFGIDVAAHRGALAAADQPSACWRASMWLIRPAAPRSLRLAKDQLLVSELPPATRPTRVRFLTRNRLTAAMSRTVVVDFAEAVDTVVRIQ